MAAPDPYLGTDEEFNPDLHWGAAPGPIEGRTYTGESVEGHQPGGEGFYSRGSGEESMQGVVDSKRIRGFMRYVLGYNNMETTGNYNLQRTNPICHPRFTNLVCTGVAHRAFWPIRTDPPVTASHQGLKLLRNEDTSGVVAVLRSGSSSTPHTFEWYAGYDKELVTLRFSPAPYRYHFDDHGNSAFREYQRYTILDTEPRTEILTLSGFQLIYCVGQGNTNPITNPYPKVAPGELGTILIKPDLKITWYDVPEKYISQNQIPGQVYPVKICRALGKVNKLVWMGYPKGTLLLNGVRLVRKPWALAAGAVGTGVVPTSVRESIFNYDIEFLISFFDPPLGYQNNAAIVDATGIGTGTTGADVRGHNCLPYRGEPTGTVISALDKNAGKWFLATYNGQTNYIGNSVSDSNPGSPTLLEYIDFDTMFQSAWL